MHAKSGKEEGRGEGEKKNMRVEQRADGGRKRVKEAEMR